MTTTPWYIVYNKIANKLQTFYEINKDRSGELLFDLLNSSKVYKNQNLWLSNIKRIETPSIDPIQLFVSFNRSNQQSKNRILIINEVCRLLGVKISWDQIDFEGCPSPVALKLQYVRPISVQKQIWAAFNSLIEIGKDSLTLKLWEDIKSWRGIQIPSFSIFMFWIDSENFLPLDKYTKQYIEITKTLILPKDISLPDYLGLLNSIGIGNYIEFTKEAYFYISKPNDFATKFSNSKYIRQGKNKSNNSFKLIGLKTLQRNIDNHKILKPNEYYAFDLSIAPKEKHLKPKSNITSFVQNYESTSLYNIEGLKINLSAIVGRNGSGKSTLIDLFLMGIYNLSIELDYLSNSENKYIENLNFEIYFNSNTLYKIVFEKDIKFYSFQETSNDDGAIEYDLINTPIEIIKLKSNFFYSILVNYSHYALNSLDYKTDWVTPLSHKNDGYLAPLVINPLRTKGNIDINSEKELLNMRLLLNLLELHDIDIPENSFRNIDNGKYINSFSIKYDVEKQNEKRNNVKDKVYNEKALIDSIYKKIEVVFELGDNYNKIEYGDVLKYYLVNKMFTLVERYSNFRNKYHKGLVFLINQNVATTVEFSIIELKLKLELLINDILIDIKEDQSHVTLKFKQVINYLKYSTLRNFISKCIRLKTKISFDKYNEIIEKIINQNEEEISKAELLPPSIFKLDFYLNDINESSISKASSGEYQLISVLSSILYHIRNIDSYKSEFKYTYISILLDEIELYFHPNMQRIFIKKLLESFNKLETDLYGIHILFATHSPFILSDIQQQNILKLRNGEVITDKNQMNTFASNIHDLLADEFFLDEGYMGAFAKQKIEQSINILNYILADNELIKELEKKNKKSELVNKLKLEKEFHIDCLKGLQFFKNGKAIEKWDAKEEKQFLFDLINIIGEPLIKNKLENMFSIAFKDDKDLNNRDYAKQEILQLMKENNIKPEELQ